MATPNAPNKPNKPSMWGSIQSMPIAASTIQYKYIPWSSPTTTTTSSNTWWVSPQVYTYPSMPTYTTPMHYDMMEPMVDGIGSLSAYIEWITGYKPVVENGMVICEDLSIIFKYHEGNITQIPVIKKSCRMVECSTSMTAKAVLAHLHTVLVFNESGLPMPERKYASVGYDLYCAEDAVINPGEMKDVSTGVYISCPPNVWMLLVNRSSTFRKHLILPTSIIDPDYQGVLLVCVLNLGKEPYQVKRGDRLAQMIPINDVSGINLQSVENRDMFPTTVRGAKGLGSSGPA